MKRLQKIQKLHQQYATTGDSLNRQLNRSFKPFAHCAALLTALAALAAGSAQAALTVTNASFEATGALYNAGAGGLYQAVGWTNLSGLNYQASSELAGQEGTSAAGATDARILRLVSDGTNTVNQGCIAQDLGTMVAGDTYTITADALGGSGGGGLLWGATAALVNQAVASPSAVYASQTVSGVAAGGNVPSAFNFSYTALPADGGNHLVLWLQATLAGSSSQASRGGIDNVRLTTVGADGLTVAVLSPASNQQFTNGASITVTATVANGTPPYTVSFYTNSAGGAYAQAGVVASSPYALNLGTLAAGATTYGIYATVTDSATPTPATATSASSVFTVIPTTWNGTSDDLWTNGANWSAGVPGASDIALFNNAGNGNTTLDLTGGVATLKILFDTAAAAAYTIGAGAVGSQTLTLHDNGAIQINGTVTKSQYFDAAITLGTATAAAYTLTNASAAATLFLEGNVSGGAGGAAGAKTLNVGSPIQIDGDIANGGATSLSLNMTGAGALVLDGTNTFSGGLTLSSGTLRMNSATALGTGTFTIGAAALDNTSGATITNADNNAQSWNGNFTFTGSGSLDLGAGAVTMNTNRTVTISGNSLTVEGAIGGGAVSLTKAGPGGRLALSGANTYSGGTVVSAGTLSYLTTAAKPGSGTTTAAAAATGTLATLGLGVSGTGAFTSTDVDNLFAGNFVGNVANVSLNATSLVGIDTSLGDFTFADSVTSSGRGLNKVGLGTLTLSGAIAVPSVICSDGALTILGSVKVTNGVFAIGSSAGPVKNPPTVNIEPGAVVNVVNGANACRTYIGGRVDNLGSAGWGTLNMEGGLLSIPAPGTGAAGDASGFWLNPYANGGTVTVNLDGGVLATARPLQDGGSGNSVLNLNGGTLQATAATVLFGNAGNYLLGTYNVRNGGAVIDTQGFNATIGSPLIHSSISGDNSPDGGLTKTGSGALTLLGVCTYNGVTTISNGTLVVNGSLNGGGAVNVIAPAALACSGQISGPLALTAGSAGLLLTNIVGNTVNLSAGLALSNGNSLTFALGTAQNQLALNYGPFTQAGTATIYITPLVGFTVGTYDLITYAQGITSAHFTLGTTIPGYTMSLTNPDSATLALVVQSPFPLTAFWHNRSGALWTVASNWDTDISSDVAASSAPGIPSAVTFSANDANAFDTTLGADFSINSLTFSTPNNVAIGGSNTLTLNGNLAVNSGAGSNTISASGMILGVNQVWTVTDPGNTLWVSSAVSGASSLTVTGAGTLVLSGTSTYTGSTTVNASTLNVAPGGALNGTGSLISVSGGALTISGPVNSTNGVFAVGAGSSGVGTVNIESGAVVNVVNGANACRVYIGGKLDGSGGAGRGILNMEGGALNIPVGGVGAAGDGSAFWLNPYASGGASTLNLDGGVLATGRPIQDGGSGASVVNFNGGVLQAAANTVLFGNAGNYALGAFNVRNGGEIIDTHGFNATIGSPQLHSTISGDNDTDGGLTKLGSGALTVLGASAYNGGTIVSAGTLLVNNTTGSGTGSNVVTVLSGATLGGSGFIGGPVTVQSGATLSPGAASIGNLTINSNLTLAGNLFIKINKSLSPSNSQVVVTGALTNAGVGTVTVTNIGATALAAGDRFQLFSQPLLNGQALAITPAPGYDLAWSNNLALDGSITAVAIPLPVLSGIATLKGASFTLSFSGTNGQSYTVLRTTNLALPLADWTPLTNGTFGAGPVNYTDIHATNAAQFYRIASP